MNPIETEDCGGAVLEMADGSIAVLSVPLGSADEISRLATGDWPTRDLPGTLEPLPLAVGGAVSVAIIAGWLRQARRDPGVPSAITAGALAAAWLVPPTYEWNHVTCLLVLVHSLQLGWLALAGVAAVAALLIYEHRLVKPHDFSRVNAAFFTMNGYVSVLFFVFWAADVYLGRNGAV